MIPLQYESAEPFSEGFARVQTGGKWGYIDRRGKPMTPAIFDTALDFSEGLAVVGIDLGYQWYIDRSGLRAIPRFYTSAGSFVMGRAHVHEGNDPKTKWSYIDKTVSRYLATRIYLPTRKANVSRLSARFRGVT